MSVYRSMEGLRVFEAVREGTTNRLRFSVDSNYVYLNGYEVTALIKALAPYAQEKKKRVNARTEERTDFDTARDILALIDRQLDYVTWRKWSTDQVEAACDFAARAHLQSADNDYSNLFPYPPHVAALPEILR